MPNSQRNIGPIAFCALLVLCSIVPNLSLAHTNEWAWKVIGIYENSTLVQAGPTTTFSNKDAAVAALRELKPIRSRGLRWETGATSTSQSWVRYKFVASAPTDPIYSQWTYTRYTAGQSEGAEESALTAAMVAYYGMGTTVTAAGSWYVPANGPHNPYGPSMEFRSYRVDHPHALPAFSYQSLTRTRSITCPEQHALRSTAPYCHNSYVGYVDGRPLECSYTGPSPRVGNPCDVANGNKTQVEVDYSGDTLQFVRTFNSSSMESSARVGTGWTHNYHSRLILSSGIPHALRRGGGIYQRLALKTDRYVDVSGSPLQVKKSAPVWIATLGDGTKETYDSSGRLVQIVKRGGGTITLSYNLDGDLTTVADESGHTLQLVYASGRLQTVIDPASHSISYTYDSLGNLERVTFQDAGVRQYHYENVAFPNRLTGISAEGGARLTNYAYDTMGRVVSSERVGGVGLVTLQYNPTSTNVTDAAGVVSTYSFTTDSALARRITAIARGGFTQSFAVPSSTTDVQRRVTLQTDANGNGTSYTFGTYALLSRTDAVGTPRARTTTFQYSGNSPSQPTLVVEPGRSIAHSYDANGRWLTRTITNTATGATRVWTRTYDLNGRLSTEDGPRTDVSDLTTYTYYTCTTGAECGQLHTVTNALNQVTTYTSYNAHGQPLSITDPNEVVTTMTYDLRQRLTSRTTGGETTTMEYWPTGLLKKVIQPDSSFILYTYDAAQRLIRMEDNLGNRADYTLDNMGNRTAENAYDPSSSLRRTHSQVFNSLNQLWKDVNAAGTTAVTTEFSYDANGNLVSTAAPLSRTTTNAYDELNRLSQVTDPATGVTQFVYDANDNLTSVLDPKGLTTSYTYNGFGDQLTQVSPDTGTTINTYDSAGNLATSTDARSAGATYSYDSTNRVTQVAYGDQTIVYGYDAGTNGKGRLTSASDALHSMSWTYDVLGRVTGKGQTVGGTTLSIGYGYSSGRLTTTTLPSGQVLSYSYNAAGQVTGVSVGATTILTGVLYEPFGPVRQWTWGNSTLAVRTYDMDYKVTQIDSGGFKALGYDDAFRITSITDGSDPNRNWTYDYDSLDRLTVAASTPTTRGWTYDANGNRLTETGGAPSTFTYTVAPGSNKIATVTGSLPRIYSYDSAGNTTGFAGAAFTYNNRGRMATATYSGTTANYVYNALGQRIRRIVPSATTLYLYDEAGHIVGEYDAAGTLIQETVWMGDIPVATLRPRVGGGVDVFYVHTDHLDTPRVVTQPSNNAERWRWDSDPFGTNLPNENPSGAGTFVYNLRFPGQQYDGLVGMHYNYFRDYDSSTGRYFQSDPIGLAGGINTYGYVGANPISYSDSTGLQRSEARVPSAAEVQEMRERSCARQAFWRNYDAMRTANWKFSDKYFHCKANCEAARCGPAGYSEACTLSNTREAMDQMFGDPASASAADQAANRFGRDVAAKATNATCQIGCSRYRPRGLPAQY